MIPLFKPYISKRCIEEVKDTLESGYIGEGPKVKKFEEILSNFYDGYVVLVNSCTSALHLSYHIAGVARHDVISTPMTCMATNTPLLQNNARIIWADVNPMTGNIDLDSVINKITWRTKAVVCTHYGGNMCGFELYAYCRKKNIALIEDCAHIVSEGLGGYRCYSFQAIKHLTTGDGGCLVTDSKEIYDRAKLLRWYGINREAGETMRCMNPVYEAGYKFHMNDISASIGITNFKDLEEIMSKVSRNAAYYNENLRSLINVKLVPVESKNDYWLYIILVKNRDKFMTYMKNRLVETSLVHARNDLQPIFNKSRCRLPGLDRFWKEQVCIPVGWWLSDDDLYYIVESIKAYDKICVS